MGFDGSREDGEATTVISLKKLKYDVKDRDDQVVGAFFNYAIYCDKSSLFPNGYKL